MDNPFTTLEQAALASENADKAVRAIAKARSQILLASDARSAFFGMLCMRLQPRANPKVETSVVDGRFLDYNPAWVAGLDQRQAVGFIAHEVLHCAMQHHTRRGTRDIAKWNIAADLACNSILVACQYTLPPSAPVPGQGKYNRMPPDMSAEEYYLLLDEPSPPGAGGGSGTADADGQGPPSSDPGGCGGVKDAGDDADKREAEGDWRAATAAAEHAAKQRGDLPAGLQRIIQDVMHAPADWREILRRFVQRASKNEYSWSPPNRRLIHLGLYLPSVRSETLGRVVLAVDTSGSIGQKELAKFAAEAQAVLDGYDVDLEIMFHDSEVQHVQHWRPEDGPLVLEPKGGGGTSHIPVFERIDEGDPPTCVICLTDGLTLFPRAEPDYPTLWALTTDVDVPFGDQVRIGI